MLMSPCHLRRYRASDADHLWQIFYQTVHQSNQNDYSASQLSAWAPATQLEHWKCILEKNRPFVAMIDTNIVGYADVQLDGMIDHFFVDHRYQRQGIGACLMQKIETFALSHHIVTLTAHVSITARPFFQNAGFVVVNKQRVQCRGEMLTNFLMIKPLTPSE